MAELLSKYFTEEELAPTYEPVMPEPSTGDEPGNMTKEKAQAMVAAFPYIGARFFPAGKEEYVGVSVKKLAKKHDVSVAKAQQLYNEWQEAMPVAEETI